MAKNIFKVFILVIFLCEAGYATADTTEKATSQSNRWMEEIKTFKHSFLIKEIGLSEEQSELFLPIYEEMEEEIYQANKDARNLEQDLSLSSRDITDDEYAQVATALSQVKTKEAEIENRYFNKFSSILNKKQLFLLKRAENRFAVEMLNHNKLSKKSK